MDRFLDQNDVVLDMSSFDESPFIFRDDFGEHFFEAVCYDFGDDLISGIAERDRSKAGEELGSFLFGDEG